VVIDPIDHEVTHLIVKKGILFPEDKVIPIEMVNIEVGDRIDLKESRQDLKELPNFEESHYVRLEKADYEGEIEANYWYPPVYTGWQTGNVLNYTRPQFVLKTEKNIPDGAIALEEGAKVISKDGEHVGNIERIIIDPEDNRATHFVVVKGLLLKTQKLVPTFWIKDVAAGKVHLHIKTSVFERLSDYFPE
jgi:uncharacterized protein YrrD